MTVEADQSLSDCGRGKVAVRDHYFIAVTHFHEYFQKLGREDRGDSFKHIETPYLLYFL